MAKQHSKPTTIKVEPVGGGEAIELKLEEGERLFRIEKANGFNNWKLPDTSKYEVINGSLIIRNTGVDQNPEGANPITEGAGG